jgi:hypothetical protein
MFRTLLVLAAALAVLVPTAAAQSAADALRYSQRDVGVGSRAIGLGGVGAAGLADVSALVTNPAGLGYYQTSEVSGSFAFGVTGVDALYEVGQGSFGFDETAGTGRVNAASYIARAPTARGSLVFGATYNQTASFDRTLAFRGTTTESSISTSFLPFADEYSVSSGGDLTIFYDPAFIAFSGGLIEFLPENLDSDQYPFYEAVTPGTTIRQQSEVRERGALHEVSFGGAVEVAPQVMVGAGLNLAVGSYELERRFEEIDINDENGLDDYVVLLDDRDLRGFNSSRYDVGVESDLLGVSGRIGISMQPERSPLRFGLTAETPTYLTVNEDFFTRVETTFDQGGSLSFSTLDDDSFVREFEYAIVTPWRLGAGIAYAEGPAYLSLDVETLDYDELRFEDVNGDASFFFDDLNQQIGRDYGRVYNVRIGGEYTYDRFTLRGGVAFEQDPSDDSSVFDEGEEGERINRDRATGSFGASIALGNRTALDLGYSLTYFEDANIPYEDSVALPFVTEDVQRSRFLIGVRVGF